MSDENVLKQNLEEKAPDFRQLIWIHLLFGEKPQKPEAPAIQAALSERFGEVDVVSADPALTSFAARGFPVKYKDATVPAQVLVAEPQPFVPGELDAIQRSQLWDLADGEEFLAGCHYKLLISDFMASGLPYKERCALITGWLEAALALFPACRGVWVPSSGKLLTREQVLQNPLEGEDRFLFFGVNVRFFRIQDTPDMLVDTLGLYALGLPDIQVHFHTLDPNPLVNYLYNVASYIYSADAPVKSGETIDGLGPDGSISRDVRWTCQYESALIQPARDVMDICPGEFAAGGRAEAE